MSSLDFKLENSIYIVLALVCLHNFLLTDEMNLNEEERMYRPEGNDRAQIPRENIIEENMNDANPRLAYHLKKYFG